MSIERTRQTGPAKLLDRVETIERLWGKVLPLYPAPPVATTMRWCSRFPDHILVSAIQRLARRREVPRNVFAFMTGLLYDLEGEWKKTEQQRSEQQHNGAPAPVAAH